jgi:carbonic anhydrase
MATGKFVTAINCIDGRAHFPVKNWLNSSFDAEFVDRITEPGADKALAGGSADVLEAIKRQVLISVNAHNSKTVAVVGHHDCAANPVSEAQHKQDIREAVATVQSWDLPVQVIGLWVNSKWQVEVVSPMEGD